MLSRIYYLISLTFRVPDIVVLSYVKHSQMQILLIRQGPGVKIIFLKGALPGALPTTFQPLAREQAAASALNSQSVVNIFLVYAST